MNRTNIQWCDYSVNPIAFRDDDGKRVWACEKVSAGCQHCYASALNARFHGSEFTAKWMASVTPYLDEGELRKMLTFRPKPPFVNPSGRAMVFVGDMTDVGGAWVPDEWLHQLFAVAGLRPDVDLLLLTKRPERWREYLTWRQGDDTRAEQVAAVAYQMAKDFRLGAEAWDKCPANIGPWPLPNVWLGTSVEDQASADQRIPELLASPAAMRFLSCEPLLGPVMLTKAGWCHDAKGRSEWTEDAQQRPITAGMFAGLDWVIIGGESGTSARPCDIAWIRSLRDQCRAAKVPVFVKQLGQVVVDRNDAGFDGDGPTAWPSGTRTNVSASYQGAPLRVFLRDRHGGNPEEWPTDLNVREFPEVAR